MESLKVTTGWASMKAFSLSVSSSWGGGPWAAAMTPEKSGNSAAIAARAKPRAAFPRAGDVPKRRGPFPVSEPEARYAMAFTISALCG